MKPLGTRATGTDLRMLRLVAPCLVWVSLTILSIASPADAGIAQDTGGGSVGGFGWSFLIPAAVVGLVVLGALLAARVGRSSGPDPVPDDTEHADDDTQRPHEDPPT